MSVDAINIKDELVLVVAQRIEHGSIILGRGDMLTGKLEELLLGLPVIVYGIEDENFNLNIVRGGGTLMLIDIVLSELKKSIYNISSPSDAVKVHGFKHLTQLNGLPISEWGNAYYHKLRDAYITVVRITKGNEHLLDLIDKD